MAKASHVVSKKRTSDAINDMPGPKFVINDTKRKCKRSLLWKSFTPFNTAFHPEMKEHRICLICHGIGIDKALKVGEKHSGQSIQQCTLIFGTL
jgi:NAD(P)H-flavin reductase